MTDPTVDRLNAALDGRYTIERNLGDDGPRYILVQNFFEQLKERVGN